MHRPRRHCVPQNPAALTAIVGRDKFLSVRGAWVLVAVGIFALGSVGSWVEARSVERQAAQRSLRSFQSSSAEIASSLQLEIQREEDLVTSTGAFVSEAPNASTDQFEDFALSAHALQRYPEILGFGHTVIVSASDLTAFVAREKLDPPAPLGPG